MTAPRPPARSRVAWAATLAGYTALLVWLTWPLAERAATHFPASSAITRMDTLHALWVLSWETHALATAPAHFLDANIYAPTPHALLYSTMGLATLPYFAPTFLVTGNPVLAANVAFLVCIALAAWGIHQVVEGWTASWLAGFVAACTFLLTPWVTWSWTPARPIHAALQYLPWIVALAARPGWRRGRAAALGILIALQGMTDPIYVAPAVIAPLAVVAFARAVRRTARPGAWGVARAIALGLLLLSPIYGAYAVVRARNPSLPEQTAWARSSPQRPSAGAEAFVLAGGIWADVRPTGAPWVVVPLLGLGLLSFACRRAERRGPSATPWLHAGLWVAVGLLVSARALVLLGDPPLVVPSPLYLVVDRLLPQLTTTFRGTIRLGIAALVGIAMLSGLAFRECARRLPGPTWALPLALVLVTAMYARWPGRGAPYPLAEPPAAATPILTALRAGEGPVLELPAGLGPVDTIAQAEAMYRSIFHWRPLLNGYGSYWPREFPARMALAAELPAATAWDALRRETGVRMVVVHRGAPRREEWATLGERADPRFRLVVRDGDDLLFAASP